MTQLTPTENLPEQRRSGSDRRLEPNKRDNIINDILKHFTTLNTGLLAIIAAFSERFTQILAFNNDYGKYFLISFYVSLLFCMIGFMLMIFSLSVRGNNWRARVRIFRDVVVLIAALGYIFSLMFFTTLYISSFSSG